MECWDPWDVSRTYGIRGLNQNDREHEDDMEDGRRGRRKKQRKKPFFERLAVRCENVGSSLCVGLDPDPQRLPEHLGRGAEATYKFCVEVIEATEDYAAAYKPNLAFFESIGVEGYHVLNEVMKAVPGDVPVIVDAKRGDIGTTARHYAKSIFGWLDADATTLNPLLGRDSIDPFLKYEGRGLYILCLTSNNGSKDFQLQQDLYLRIARRVSEWNTKGNMGLVVGATRPQFIDSIQAIAPKLPILVPGLGAQQGDLSAVLTACKHRQRHEVLFNVSRSIIFAGSDEAFGREARLAARHYSNMIRETWEKVREVAGDREGAS